MEKTCPGILRPFSFLIFLNLEEDLSPEELVTRAGLKGRGSRSNFHWTAPMTYFMTSLFVKFFFADSQRSQLVFPVVDYASAEFTRLLAAFDCKPHEMVLKNNVSCP